MSKNKTVEEFQEKISRKLDKLTGLLVIQGKEPNQRIKILTIFKFNSNMIKSVRIASRIDKKKS